MLSRALRAASGLSVLVGGLSLLAATSVSAANPGAGPLRAEARRAAAVRSAKEAGARLADVRVPFVANQGQKDPRVAFYAPGFGNTLFVTHDGDLVYSVRVRNESRGGDLGARLEKDRAERKFGARKARARALRRGFALTETLVGGKTSAVGQDPGKSGVTDFRGNDPSRWRRALSTYQGVGLGEVWPGVDVSLHARGGRAEKIFTVAPGASPDQIRVQVTGARALSVAPDGTLVASHPLGDVTFTAPIAYQERDGQRRDVTVAYRVDGLQYGFAVGTYDPALPLVIDPLLQSTFLGGNDDDTAFGMAIHPTTGAVYVAGDTFSDDFPGVDGFSAQPLPGSCSCTSDAFVALLSSDLKTLVHATYLGGSDTDGANAVAVNATTGDVYVVGITDSINFPIPEVGMVPQGYQTENGGFRDGFVARLSGDLDTLKSATYLGGEDDDEIAALVLHPTTGAVYVTGDTESEHFPPDPPTGAFTSLDSGIGHDAFVALLTSDLLTLTRSTYLGGADEDVAYAIALHPNTGDVYVTGRTESGGFLSDSDNFPGVAGGAQATCADDCGFADAFVARLNPGLTALTQATYFGGNDDDVAYSIAIRGNDATYPAGVVYVAGDTFSADLPHTTGAAQPAYAGESFGTSDTFIARFATTLMPSALTRATYYGGTGDERTGAIAIHPTSHEVYVVGTTDSGAFPDDTPIPFTAGGVQPAFGGGCGCSADVFVFRASHDLASIPQATYLGLEGIDIGETIAISPLTGSVYVAGSTTGPVFPGTAGGAQQEFAGGNPCCDDDDAFVTRFDRTLAGANLTIDVTHVGALFQGERGAQFIISVGNAGNAPSDVGSSGVVIAADGSLVTVTMTLPPGMTAVGLSGAGWTCTLATLTCTRSDSLPPGGHFPPIFMFVNIDLGTIGTVVVTGTVTGGSDLAPITTSFDAVVDISAVIPVPALSTLMQTVAALGMLLTGIWYLRRRARSAPPAA